MKKSKFSYDKALYRLVSIIAMLLRDERPTIKSLAIEFNVGIRTIQKDVYQRLGQFEIHQDISNLVIAFHLVALMRLKKLHKIMLANEYLRVL